MPESYLIRGLIIGLIFGVPAGAIGALTIQRTLERGFWAGFITGSGSSAADVIYGCAGVFGIAAISNFLLANQVIIGVIGGILICLLGVFIFFKNKIPQKEKPTKGNYIFCFTSSFMIAIMNPATILSFFIAFTSFDIETGLNLSSGIMLIAGILIGTMLWWAGLSFFVAIFRAKLTDKIYTWLNRILGTLMLVFGTVVIIRQFIGQ